MALSWMAKATVQAALGPVCLKRLAEHEHATADEIKYGEIVLMISILSIVVTAPIGAILISVSGTKLLTKTKPLHVVEGHFIIFFSFMKRIFQFNFSIQAGDAVIALHCTISVLSMKRKIGTRIRNCKRMRKHWRIPIRIKAGHCPYTPLQSKEKKFSKKCCECLPLSVNKHCKFCA